MSNNKALVLARWEVLWIHKGKVVRKDCGKDLAEAKRIYALAIRADKPGVTLRCKNVGFPPPDKYYRHPMLKKEKIGRKIIKTKVYVSRMNELNNRGIWWCPYCCELRKFVKRNGYREGNILIPDPHLACPMCGITHSNFHVQRFNPLAARLANRTITKKGSITAKTPEQKREAARQRRLARKQRAAEQAA